MLRPESCDLLAGSVVVGDETRALMTTVPYAQVHWALLKLAGQRETLAVLNGHWGLSTAVAFDWADHHHLEYDLPHSAQEALDGLKLGRYNAVLALEPETTWLRAQLGHGVVSWPADLSAQTLALGVWKTRITLRRAVAAALAESVRN